MKVFKIPVRWEVSAVIEVEAETLEEAIKEFDRYETEDEGYSLPDDEGYYVDGSFKREEDLEVLKLYNRIYD